uniref:Uncharacterized protein n=1 Tax=Pseudonaja textilis TaxID=8673 RepID=A0A670XSB2_PSETE
GGIVPLYFGLRMRSYLKERHRAFGRAVFQNVFALLKFSEEKLDPNVLLSPVFKRARDRKVIGDPESAATYGKKARYLNIAACLIGIGITVTCFLAIILSSGNILQLFQEMREKPQLLQPGQ